MKKIILTCIILFCMIFRNLAQTVTDMAGNVYHTVTIGTQIWTVENLKTIHYRDGSEILYITDSAIWTNLSSAAYCYYDNDSVTYAKTYGCMYNWFAIDDSRNLCPTGWHVPSDKEWTTLIDFLGGLSVAGGKLKEAGTAHWNSPNAGATNESGFTGLPGGIRYTNGINQSFSFIHNDGFWWSTTEAEPGCALGIYLGTNYEYMFKAYGNKTDGFSVRCICDSMASEINDFNYNYKIQIFPNPATDKIYIDCAGNSSVNLEIYNIMGEFLLQLNLNSGMNDIDIRSFKKGIYVLKIKVENKVDNFKLIKR